MTPRRGKAAWVRLAWGVLLSAAVLLSLEAAARIRYATRPPPAGLPNANSAYLDLVSSFDHLPADWPFSRWARGRTVRVVSLGESTPALPEFTAALERQLRSWRPDVPWELGRAAFGGNDIESIENLFHETLSYAPDIVILYFGHNAAFRHYHGRAFAYRILNILDHSYLMRLAWPSGASRDPSYRPDPPPERRLSEALARIAGACRKKGIALVVCVPAGNRSFPAQGDPRIFHDPSLAQALGRALFLEEAGRWPQARAAFQDLVARYPDLAQAHYELGQALEKTGSWAEARRELTAAEDLDPSRARATSAVRSAIKDAARRFALPLFDAEDDFDRRSAHGISGPELFRDNCHPIRAGFDWLAQGIVSALSSSPLARAKAAAFASRTPAADAAKPDIPERLEERLSVDRDWAYGYAFAYQDRRRCSPAILYFLKHGLSLSAAAFSAMLEDVSDGQMDAFAYRSFHAPQSSRYVKTRRLVWVHAAAAARQLGLRALTDRFLDEACRPGADPEMLALAEAQRAIGDSLARRETAARKHRRKAASLWPEIRFEPWYYCAPGREG